MYFSLSHPPLMSRRDVGEEYPSAAASHVMESIGPDDRCLLEREGKERARFRLELSSGRSVNPDEVLIDFC